MAFLFMEKMNEKMPLLEESKPKIMSLEKRESEMQILNTKISSLIDKEEK